LLGDLLELTISLTATIIEYNLKTLPGTQTFPRPVEPEACLRISPYLLFDVLYVALQLPYFMVQNTLNLRRTMVVEIEMMNFGNKSKFLALVSRIHHFIFSFFLPTEPGVGEVTIIFFNAFLVHYEPLYL